MRAEQGQPLVSARWIACLALLSMLSVLGGLVVVSAGSNTVQASRVGRSTRAQGVNDKKPSECSSIALTTIVTGSGSFTAPKSSDLVLGSALVDTIAALDGDDCILGGGGNDALDGGKGYDICIGGPGTDTFSGCELSSSRSSAAPVGLTGMARRCGRQRSRGSIRSRSRSLPLSDRSAAVRGFRALGSN